MDTNMQFPTSGQSDVVRAYQKDRLCLSMVESIVRETVHSYLGPGAVARYRDGIQAVASLIYYTCSTGVVTERCAALGTWAFFSRTTLIRVPRVLRVPTNWRTT